MQSDEIRRSFVDYFAERGHQHVPSGSLVPADDPTLLFTNAGMVQFKRVFQGLEARDYRRAVSVQKCVRAGGKHNDLEQVGHTARHHTFFEMLGNFSFGDYFKREAIEFAWEWVTDSRYLGLDPDRLYVSVHHTDDEARRLWRQVTGLAEDRIYGLGDKDNFWQMGDTGPCGPCSEVFVDLRGPSPGGLAHDAFVELGEAGELLEIWNLVFMQFDQAADGTRSPLPAPSVDTGAGLERIAAVMQGVRSNFDTDVFTYLIDRAVQIVGTPYDRGPAGAGYRVLADHARAVAFLLADGVYPSSEGRGYVLRRILRRAVRHAYLLGRPEPTLVHLTGEVVDHLGGVYPELRDRAEHISSVTRAEEERFLDTIEGGLRRVDELTVGPSGTISGADAFRLFDTYGFPIDLTRIIARERGWQVDTAGFDEALEAQRKQSRAGGAPDGTIEGAPAIGRSRTRPGKWETVTPRKRQRFVGYEVTRAETEILKYRRRDGSIDVILRDNPFYAESGGQVSDTGVVIGEGWTLPVRDVYRVDGKQVVTGTWAGPFEPTEVRAEVDEPRRRDIERNHSATHLVHAALRRVLGDHVRQAGSVVDADRLRFDFSHHQPVTPEELHAIETEVNRYIWENVDVLTSTMPYHEAIQHGAMALFGEKYGDVVRVVEMPEISVELCGGTHVRTTGQVGLFRFVGESGVAAGVRRIEARTGPGAYDLVVDVENRLREAAELLHAQPEHLARRIEGLVAERRALEQRLATLLRAGGNSAGFTRHELGDVTLYTGETDASDRHQIGMIVDAFREQHRAAIAVVFATGDRPGIHVGVTDDLVARGIQAGDIVNAVAAVSGGRGGGKPHFASAGAGDATRLGEARARAPELVKGLLSA